MIRQRAILAVVLAAVIGCNLEPRGSWRPHPAPDDWLATTFGTENVVWATDDTTDWFGPHPPMLIGNLVIIARGAQFTRDVIARDRMTGDSVWISRPGAHRFAAQGENLGTVMSWLRIRRQSDGVELRTFTDSVRHRHVASDGTNYFVTTDRDGRIVALSPTGSTLWDRKFGRALQLVDAHALALAPGRVVVAQRFWRVLWDGTETDTGAVASLDAATGAVQWRRALATLDGMGNVWPYQMLISGSNVIVSMSFSPTIVALKLEDGTEAWRYRAPGTLGGGTYSISVCGNRLIASNLEQGFIAFDPQTGTKLWENKEGVTPSFSSFCIGNLLADVTTMFNTSDSTVSRFAKLRLRDPATAAIRASYPLTDFATRPNEYHWLDFQGVSQDATGIYVLTNWGLVKLKTLTP